MRGNEERARAYGEHIQSPDRSQTRKRCLQSTGPEGRCVSLVGGERSHELQGPFERPTRPRRRDDRRPVFKGGGGADKEPPRPSHRIGYAGLVKVHQTTCRRVSAREDHCGLPVAQRTGRRSSSRRGAPHDRTVSATADTALRRPVARGSKDRRERCRRKNADQRHAPCAGCIFSSLSHCTFYCGAIL